MNETNGMIFGWSFDGAGGGTPLGWDDIRAGQPEDTTTWIHLDRAAEKTEHWLRTESGLDSIVIDALLAEETRPRALAVGDGLLVILRGVNLNPGADPEDMIAVRSWISPTRIISMRARNVMAVADIDERFRQSRGPRTASEFLVELAARLVDRTGPVIEDLDDLIDGLEEELVTGETAEIRHRLHDLRRTAIALRRYLAPQRDAMAKIQVEENHWLDRRQKARLREVTDRVIRFVEDLDEIRERAAIVQDELMNRLSEQMNRNMYLLSVVAAIMLPLGFLTGLLGINVGGMPGADSEFGFLIACTLLALIAVVEIILVRRLHWL